MTRTQSLVDWIGQMENDGAIHRSKAASAIYWLAQYRAEDLIRRDREADQLTSLLAPFEEDDDWGNPACQAIERQVKRLFDDHICEILSSWGRGDLAGLYRSSPETFHHLAHFDLSSIYLPEARS